MVGQQLMCPPGPTREELVSCLNISWSGAIQCFASSREVIIHFLSHGSFHLSADPQICRNRVVTLFSSLQHHWELHALQMPPGRRYYLMFAFHSFISQISIEHLHVTGAVPGINNSIMNKHQTQPLLLRTLQPIGETDIHTMLKH